MRILVVDHRDSFTWNLVHDLGEIDGSLPEVVDSKRMDVASIVAAPPDLLVLSPGPGHPAIPRDSGATPDLVRALAGRVPIFGVCFGMQIVATVLGARVVRAHSIAHGKSLPVHHHGHDVFAGLPSPVAMMRYHSLAVDRATLPPDLVCVGEADDGEVMALAHARLPLWGVQFHPESVGSPEGMALLKNVLAMAIRDS